MDQQIDTKPLQDEHGRLIGYTCEGATTNAAEINEVATSFYFGLQYPIGQQKAAVEYINQALLEHVATDYHLISGTACNVLGDISSSGSSSSSSSSSSTTTTISSQQQDQPSSSLLVSIQSDINRVELGQSCRDESSFFDPSLQDCQTSQLILKGLVWNASTMPDVISTVENWLQQEGTDEESLSFTNNNNPYYSIHYLGGQELEDQMVISTGSGRPNYPAYQNEGVENDAAPNQNYVTGLSKMSPLGKGMVCLLVLAFLGLVLAFVRKQKLQKIRDEERKRQLAANSNKENEMPVPELDGISSSSSPSSKGDVSSKGELSLTGSMSAGSA
ncbi:unnamed protein product [Cylindrotheca closterium]|uniref:Uncharacterized protein n=1 Tax=Cylindrotheca closterium TaxID=2856 RepID=A0AAD2CPS3_9STRA|nr:unnamed protein product [Cylindrotheca closterium]